MEFSSKASAKGFFSELRDCYGNGERSSAEHQGIVSDLLAQHPEAVSKIGQGIDCFTVQADQVFGQTRHFVVHGADGSSTDFSFHSCIDGRNRRKDVLEARRRAIADQIVDFRDQFLLQISFLSTVLLWLPSTPRLTLYPARRGDSGHL